MRIANATTWLTEYRAAKIGLTSPGELRATLDGLLDQVPVPAIQSRIYGQILDYLFSPSASAPTNLAELGVDATFARNALTLRPLTLSLGSTDSLFGHHTFSPREHDFIEDDSENQSPIKLMNRAVQMAIVPTRRAAVVTSIRNEGLSILEWIAHHKAIGFDSIIIYTNDNTDESLDLLRLLAENSIIYLVENAVHEETSPQRKAYEHSLNLYPIVYDHEWIAYLDADEFFISRCEPTLDVAALLSTVTQLASPVSAICVHWKWFGSQNAYARSAGFLFERFPYSKHNAHIKTLGSPRAMWSMRPLHHPNLLPGERVVNSEFVEINSLRPELPPPLYGAAQINHYWNKSFEEFVVKKERGRGAVGASGQQRAYHNFFDWGGNNEPGNYDPVDDRVLARMQSTYHSLLSIEGVKEQMLKINRRFDQYIFEIDRQINLKRIYECRGEFND